MHLTGEYPPWWEGRRFTRPVTAWSCGASVEAVRDVPQKMLMGALGSQGTGTLPAESIYKTTPSRSISGGLDLVLVKHVSGGLSTCHFKTYEQDVNKWRGHDVHVIMLDEEPDMDHYTEALARISATDGIIYLVVTPLDGVTEVVRQFHPNPTTDSRALVMMDLFEAKHFTEKQRRQAIESYPAHEREARVKGIPMLGEGRVYTVPESVFVEESFTIPSHWPQIGGLDLGYDHPTAGVWMAWDRDSDTIHVTYCYKQKHETPVVHARALKARGDWIPWAWPKDAIRHDPTSGMQLAQQYRAEGVRMLPNHATFEDGSVSVEAAVMEILDRLQTGRFKVFEHLHMWLDEYRLYHRKKGQIVRDFDDLMAATRYAVMMLRFARTHAPRSVIPHFVGQDYDPLNPRRHRDVERLQ